MKDYDISYQILDYKSYNKRLDDLINGNYKNRVIKLPNLGYTSCGFPIEHYSIGSGKIHVVFMAGCHGNEIIGVDFVTQLMKNMAMNLGTFSEIDFNKYTFDFIPLQNPEGFYTTTYALKSLIKDMNDGEIESFCKGYFNAYKEDDRSFLGIEKLLDELSSLLNIKIDNIDFWNNSRFKDISKDSIVDYLSSKFEIKDIKDIIDNAWNNNVYLSNIISISKNRKHHEYFSKVSFDCIPLIDDVHKNLKNKLVKMYSENNFPIGTLANFFANSDGINLNDNNESFYKIFKERISSEGAVYGKKRDNVIIKSIPSPCGCPNYDMNKPFDFAIENKIILKFLENNKNYMFLNCHGTGGGLYVFPIKTTNSTVKESIMIVNKKISDEYFKGTDDAYKKFNGTEGYKLLDNGTKVTSFDEVLRSKYEGSILLELSKMGGNPIAPYGDRLGNYNITIVANFEGIKRSIDAIMTLLDVYES